jgi:hypothetical protein
MISREVRFPLLQSLLREKNMHIFFYENRKVQKITQRKRIPIQ